MLNIYQTLNGFSLEIYFQRLHSTRGTPSLHTTVEVGSQDSNCYGQGLGSDPNWCSMCCNLPNVQNRQYETPSLHTAVEVGSQDSNCLNLNVLQLAKWCKTSAKGLARALLINHFSLPVSLCENTKSSENLSLCSGMMCCT